MVKHIETIRFHASLPPIATAFTVDGQDREINIKLTVPASDFAEGVKVSALSGVCFGVVIYPAGLPDE